MTTFTSNQAASTLPDSIVVGGGIGGLTYAIAMAKQGKKVQVFEQARAIRPVGAGITLGVNAMRVFQELGIADELLAKGNRFGSIQVKSYNGKVLSTIDNRKLEADLGMPSVGIHRANLYDVLLQHLPSSALRLGEKLSSYTQTSDGVTAHFESGTSIPTQLLVGADGIGSSVCKTMFGELTRRDAKQICFRGICDASGINWSKEEMFEAWGKAKRFGVVPIGQDKIYWFLTINRDSVGEPLPESQAETKPFLVDAFRGWCEPIPTLLAQTEPDMILRNDLYDRPPMDQWHDGRVVLMGDAAHPTTPNMGQGAGMAIESAAVLANCLQQDDELSVALSRYEQLRMARTRAVTNQSWRIGQIATLSNNAAMGIRNFVVKQMSGLAYKQAQQLFGYDIYSLG